VTEVSPQPTFVRQRVTWMLYALVGFFAYFDSTLGPIMVLVRAERDYSYSVAGTHFSAFAVGGLLAGFLGDRFVRRLGRPRSLTVAVVGLLTGAALLAASPIALGSLLGVAFVGGFGALVLMTAQSGLSDLHGEYRRVAITESTLLAASTAILGTLLVGSIAASGFDWRLALVPPALVLVLIPRILRLPETEIDDRARARGRLTLRFWMVWLVLFLSLAAYTCVMYWGAEFLAQDTGLERATAVTALSLLFISILSARLIGSRLARRFGEGLLLSGCLVVASASFLLLWLSENPIAALVGLFGVGLGFANVYPLAISMGIGAVGGAPEAATARLALAQHSAALTAPLFLGALADRAGISSAISIVGIFLATATVLAITAQRQAATTAASVLR
jgi:fucose permease